MFFSFGWQGMEHSEVTFFLLLLLLLLLLLFHQHYIKFCSFSFVLECRGSRISRKRYRMCEEFWAKLGIGRGTAGHKRHVIPGGH